MKVWVYVEGEADSRALEALWTSCGWLKQLRAAGWGLHVLALDDKARFFKRIGSRAGQKLVDSDRDLVVGLPDLFPTGPFEGTSYEHHGSEELMNVQVREVRNALKHAYGVRDPESLMGRFCASALKHDLEMLLLCADAELRSHLHVSGSLGNWRQIVENQNGVHPPKRVVEEIFQTRSPKRQAYRDTVHGPAVLRQVTNLTRIMWTSGRQLKCPVFRSMLDWVGSQTGIPAYTAD